MKEKRKERAHKPEVEILKGFMQSLKLAPHNNEFALFWLTGVLLHVIALKTFNSYEWIAIGIFDWVVVGGIAVRHTVKPIENAFAHCGVSFSSAYGTPRWVMAPKYPCSKDTIEFTGCGHPAESYQPYVGRISAGLRLPIQTVTEPMPGAQILQAHIVRTQIPSMVTFDEIDLSHVESGQFVYGKTNRGFKYDFLKDAIHMLVAGQTGSGKTFFIQQIAMTILSRSRNAHAAIIDMKGGVDFPDFRSLQNCELVTTHKDAHELLEAVSKTPEQNFYTTKLHHA